MADCLPPKQLLASVPNTVQVDEEKDGELKKKILAYFTSSSEELEDDWTSPPPELPSAHILSVVLRDIRSFIMKYHELPLRGRVIARIFQGISSPNYPATTWGRIRWVPTTPLPPGAG